MPVLLQLSVPAHTQHTLQGSPSPLGSKSSPVHRKQRGEGALPGAVPTSASTLVGISLLLHLEPASGCLCAGWG